MTERAPVSINKLTWIGMLWVNVPVMAIFCIGGVVIPWLYAANLHTPWNVLLDREPLLVLVWGLGTFGTAWFWWSVTVVKWRVWALARTDNWQQLEATAIQDGLIWNRNTICGRILGRTEIWTRMDREREAELKRLHAASRKDR